MNKKLFLALHGVVICLGIYACVVLFNARGGHPPGIIFLPVAAVAWIFLHIFLGGMQKLASMGENRAYDRGRDLERWPSVLILVVIASSIIFINGIPGLTALVFSQNQRPQLLALMSVLQAVNLACLCGILLRRDWARIIAGSAFVLFAGLILFRLAPVLLWGAGLGIIELIYAAALIGASSGLGYYLLTSRRVQEFFVD